MLEGVESMSLSDLFNARIIFGDFSQVVSYLCLFVPISLLISFFTSCMFAFFKELFLGLGGNRRGRYH